MIDPIDRQMMADIIFSTDDDEIDLLCLCRNVAIKASKIRKVVDSKGNISVECGNPMALARIGRDQREHRDRNLKSSVDCGFKLIDGVTY